MRTAYRLLLPLFIINVATAVLIALLGETYVLSVASMENNKGLEFLLVTVMELLTLCVIPVALRLFRFGFVRRSADTGGAAGKASLRIWGIVRIDMLHVPMILNTLLYYLFMNVAFGYMAIILFLASLFVVPTKSRCMEEFGADE